MVKIITDSTCDLTKERMEEIGVTCVPLTVHIGNDIYLDGVDLSKAEFYEKLRTEKSFPTTAHPILLRKCLRRRWKKRTKWCVC